MMKNLIRFSVTTLLLAAGFTAHAQQPKRAEDAASASKLTLPVAGEVAPAGAVYYDPGNNGLGTAGHKGPLGSPADVTLPISTIWENQSNGRSLHNIQVDPDHPNNVHVVLMGTTGNAVTDTANAYPTRRCMYTFSSDAGQHWTTPVVFNQTLKTGYPNMILYKRASDGKYVPMIAAHHITAVGATTFVSAIYIEKGNPGDGNFLEVNTTRVASDKVQRDIIWPAIAVSNDQKKVFVAGDVSTGVSASYAQMQFGSFSLATDGKSATFDGWTDNPGSHNDNFTNAGLSYAGGHVIHVAEDGRIGLLWNNLDPNDGGFYFVESSDAGKTWSSTYPAALWTAIPQKDPVVLSSTDGMDFWYEGNIPKFVLLVNSQDLNGKTYYPTLCGLYFINPKAISNDYSPDSSAILTSQSGFIQNSSHVFANPIGLLVGSPVSTQGTLFSEPTVARTSDPNKFTLFFRAIADGDSEYVGKLTNDTTRSFLTYGSLWYMSTVDGGANFTDPIAFRTNDGAAKKQDYRSVSVSDWNPIVGGVIQNAVCYQVDTAAGVLPYFGGPGFGIQTFNFSIQPVSNVKPTSNPVSFRLNQNYPNPFTPSTSIAFELKQDANVLLTITDEMGRPVSTLINSRLAAGPHTANFATEHLAAGVYRYTLTANGESSSKMMTLIK